MEQVDIEELKKLYEVLSELKDDVLYNKDIDYFYMPSKYLEIIDKYKDDLDTDFVNELEKSASEIETLNDYNRFVELIDNEISSLGLEELEEAEIEEEIIHNENQEDFLAELFEDGMRKVTAFGIGAALLTGGAPIAIGNYATVLAATTLPNLGIMFAFNQSNLLQIASIAGALSMIDNINLNLINDSKDDFSKLIITSKDDSVSIDEIINTINSVMENARVAIDEVTLNMIQLFESAVNNDITVNMSMKNDDGEKKFAMATNNPELVEYVQENGIKVSESGKIIFENNEQASKFFANMKGKINDMNKDDFEVSNNNEEDIVLPGESKVDFYTKYIKDEFGNPLMCRLSVVRQNKNDSDYERLVNITYINQQTGEIKSSSSVYTYTDAYMLDSDVLPALTAEGFEYQMTLTGKNISVNDNDPTKCCLFGECDEKYSDDYNFDNRTSILAMDGDNNIFGDVNGVINATELDREKFFDVLNKVDSIQFENEVTDTKEDVESLDDDEYTYANNKTMVKKLGEYPTNINSEKGNVNVFNLALFLIIDMAAIVMGLFLLLK